MIINGTLFLVLLVSSGVCSFKASFLHIPFVFLIAMRKTKGICRNEALKEHKPDDTKRTKNRVPFIITQLWP